MAADKNKARERSRIHMKRMLISLTDYLVPDGADLESMMQIEDDIWFLHFCEEFQDVRTMSLPQIARAFPRIRSLVLSLLLQEALGADPTDRIPGC